MSYTIIITPQMLAIVGGIASLLLTVFGWIARLFWNKQERDSAQVIALFKQADERHEVRQREIQAVLRDLSSQVGRLEGAVGVHDGSAGQSRQRYTRSDDHPASEPDGESDAAQAAGHSHRSRVPLAGGPAEPRRAAGLALQATPDPPQDGETDSEPKPKDSLDTAG